MLRFTERLSRDIARCHAPKHRFHLCKLLAGEKIRKKYRRAYIRKIQQREYKNLKKIIPTMKKESKADKVTVLEEAVKYIDELHTALLQRFAQGRLAKHVVPAALPIVQLLQSGQLPMPPALQQAFTAAQSSQAKQQSNQNVQPQSGPKSGQLIAQDTPSSNFPRVLPTSKQQQLEQHHSTSQSQAESSRALPTLPSTIPNSLAFQPHLCRPLKTVQPHSLTEATNVQVSHQKRDSQCLTTHSPLVSSNHQHFQPATHSQQTSHPLHQLLAHIYNDQRFAQNQQETANR